MIDVERFKWALGSVVAFVVQYWYLILALAVFVVVGYTVDSCRQASRERKIEQIGANITEQRTISNVLANEKANVAGEVANNEKNTNSARNDLDRSRAADSNSFPGAESERKFCRRFPLDSSCRAYCAKYGCP